MKTEMQIHAHFGESSYSQISKTSITLKVVDIKSIIDGVIPDHIIKTLQQMAKQKVEYDLKKAEEAKDIQKSSD